MTANTPDWDDEIGEELTLAASDGSIDRIRAETARVRGEMGDEPTTPEASADPGLANEPTIITFDSFVESPAVESPAVESPAAESPASSDTAFDPSDDPTTVMGTAPSATAPSATAPQAVAVETAAKPEPKAKSEPASAAIQQVPVAAVPTGSLIGEKAAPAPTISYWDRGEMATDVESAKASGKGPIPVWFIATSLLAVVLAAGLVVLVLWALSGTTA